MDRCFFLLIRSGLVENLPKDYYQVLNTSSMSFNKREDMHYPQNISRWYLPLFSDAKSMVLAAVKSDAVIFPLAERKQQ